MLITFTKTIRSASGVIFPERQFVCRFLIKNSANLMSLDICPSKFRPVISHHGLNYK